MAKLLDNDIDLAIIEIATDILEDFGEEPKRKKKKRASTRDWIQRRQPQELIFREFEDEDRKKFIQCFRMSPETFDKLLGSLWPYLIKQDTAMKESIRPKVRLQVTLVYLCSGCTFGVLENQFRIPVSTVSYIVAETCEVIWNILSPRYIQCPKNTSEWLAIAKGFEVNRKSCNILCPI